MDDKKIIELYENGYSMKYIADKFYRFKNKKQKPILLNGTMLFPASIFKKSECEIYVYKTIYSYIINKDKIEEESEKVSTCDADDYLPF